MKYLSSYPGCHEVRSALAEFFWSIDKGRMWCYNILGYNNGSISHILQLDPINTGYFILTSNLVWLKRENPDPILTVKRIEWRKFNDYFGLSIEADPSRVGKKNLYIFHIYHIPIPSSVRYIYQGTILTNSLICNHKSYVCTNQQKILLLRLCLIYLLPWETYI